MTIKEANSKYEIFINGGHLRDTDIRTMSKLYARRARSTKDYTNNMNRANLLDRAYRTSELLQRPFISISEVMEG